MGITTQALIEVSFPDDSHWWSVAEWQFNKDPDVKAVFEDVCVDGWPQLGSSVAAKEVIEEDIGTNYRMAGPGILREALDSREGLSILKAMLAAVETLEQAGLAVRILVWSS